MSYEPDEYGFETMMKAVEYGERWSRSGWPAEQSLFMQAGSVLMDFGDGKGTVWPYHLTSQDWWAQDWYRCGEAASDS